MMTFSTWDILRNLLLATRWTLLLSFVSFFGGALVGLLVLSARMSSRRWGRRLAVGYIELLQGTPLLMQLFLVFFGFGLIGIDGLARHNLLVIIAINIPV